MQELAVAVRLLSKGAVAALAPAASNDVSVKAERQSAMAALQDFKLQVWLLI